MANDKHTPVLKQKDESTLRQLEQILANKPKYIVKSDKELRHLSNNPTLEELYAVVATMLKDFKKQTIFK